MVHFCIRLLCVASLFISCTKSEGIEKIKNKIERAEQVQQRQEEDKKQRTKGKAEEALEFCKKNNYSTDFCILVDMKVPSGKNRMFVWDFKNDSIAREALCAHGMGRGSTQETPVFNNENGSYCTSLGKYKLGIRSYSQWGINVHYKMHGLEKTNNNAYKRIVVLHSHNPVPDEEIDPEHLPLGWSLGCPVTSNEMMRYLDKRLQKEKKPVLFWIYQ